MKQESQKAQSTKPSTKRKRTSKKKPQGLGDVVESVAKATKIDKIVKAVVGDDCGCERRKKYLNKVFSFFKVMSDDQKKLWEEEIAPHHERGTVTKETQQKINQLYEDVFGLRYRLSRCGSCVNTRLNHLKDAYHASCKTESTEGESE